MDIFKKQNECDYETDKDNLKHAKIMLRKDLIESIAFFVKHDPLLLVLNA